MRTAWLHWLLGATALCALTSAQEWPYQVHDPCAPKTTCGECIRTRTCAWCSDPESTDKQRCFQPGEQGQTSCPDKFVHNPANELTVTEDRAARKTNGADEAVQVSPQRVALKLRPNEPRTLTLRFSQAEDYPVDLYYLMDLSQSMNDDKDLLSKLGDDVAGSMTNITSNFRLGFGSFVDKKVMPFVSTVPKKLESPCAGCVAPYGFKNHMRLSEDTRRFSGEVQRAPISGNLDAPEGGFDAIMQAVVCRDEIGWREKARRLLVFSTDAGFHYAGDGKLGGIVEPNDGTCHLDEDGVYTHSTTLDYPSISQVNLKVKQNAINVIFAVTQEQLPIYERLGELIEGSIVGRLSEDSSNVVDFIKEQYSRISSSVELKDTASSAVKVTYSSQCLDPSTAARQTSQCDGLKVGNEVNFTIELRVTQCPPDKKDWKQQLKIYPVGINESLIVDLEMLCDCPCERPGHTEHVERSARCNSHGALACGRCLCDEDHFGRQCECDADNAVDSGGRVNCRPDNASRVDCSSQGACVCGQCECNTRMNPLEVISGQYCECDNFSCDYGDGQLCSGPDHGVCSCGVCACEPGWSGDSCDCPEGDEACLRPGDTVACSGRGECLCGQCECRGGAQGRYQGRFCATLPVLGGLCSAYKDCVQCRMYGTGPGAEDCARACGPVSPDPVEEAVAREDRPEVACTYFDDEGCRFAYVYSLDGDEGTVAIRAQRERVCPEPVYVMGIAAGVIGAIVVIGVLMLLLWKVLTTIHDRREFAKFENERMRSKWDTGENPLFKQATSTFANPMYKSQ